MSEHLSGGAPFTPSKPSFLASFENLLKKDGGSSAGAAPPTAVPIESSPATPAASASAATHTSSTTNGSTSKGAKAPTQEDLNMLMDQIATLSQSLADAQMTNVEVRQQSEKTQLLYDQMKIERDFMLKKCETTEKEMTKLKEKISFSALDATNEQLKQVRAELAAATTENEALKGQNQILYQNYADLNGEYQTLHEAAETKAADWQRLRDEMDALEREHGTARDERTQALADLEQVKAELAALQAETAREQREAESAKIAEITQARDTLAKELETTRTQLHDMTTDRNRCKRMMESIQIEMQKLHAQMNAKGAHTDKENQRLADENQRLREDLARKAKSLQDALTALATQAATSNFRPPAEPAIMVTTSSSSVGARDLTVLQTLCNRLSETIKEKDDLIGVLRKQCAGLGRRVIELEAGTLPDFSERAIERRESVASEAPAASAPPPTSRSGVQELP